MKDHLKKRPLVIGKIVTKDVKLERPVKVKKERVGRAPLERAVRGWFDVPERALVEPTTPPKGEVLFEGLTYTEWQDKKDKEEREKFMKHPDVNIGYARKLALQIIANDDKGLQGDPEDLAQHLMDAGRWNAGVFHKEYRKLATIDSAMHWQRTAQGHEFWDQIYNHTHQIPEHTGKKHI